MIKFMNSRWKKGLAFGAAAGAVWLGAEMYEENRAERPKPPVSDRVTDDISHAVRDRLKETTRAVRPRPHFVPPLPPREPLELDDPERPPVNLAGHMGTTGVDEATHKKIVSAIFAKAYCLKAGEAAHAECVNNQDAQGRKTGEGEKSLAERFREFHEIQDAIRECEAASREAEEECMREKRREDPEALETEEHYFRAQGAERLAVLEEAVSNSTPIHPMELMSSLGHIQFLIMQPTTDGLTQRKRLEDILGDAGLSVEQYYDMLTRIRDDYISPDEENDPENDHWDPAKEPPPPNPALMRNIVDDLLDMVSQ